MMYAGTVTISDPLLAWEIDNMPEGYKGYVRVDDHAGSDSPRDWAPNGATFIQESDRYIAIDEDDAGLREAREFFYGRNREYLMGRYLAMFRPDIVHYEDYLTLGGGYGWGYVTRENLAEIGYSEDGRETVSGTLKMRAKTILDEELKVYEQWANGEVYGVTVVHEESGEEASLWGIYDDYPYDYMHGEIVNELITEIEV